VVDRLTIEFNHTMGQVTLFTNDRNNVTTYDLDYECKLGEIVQEYYDEVRR